MVVLNDAVRSNHIHLGRKKDGIGSEKIYLCDINLDNSIGYLGPTPIGHRPMAPTPIACGAC